MSVKKTGWQWDELCWSGGVLPQMAWQGTMNGAAVDVGGAGGGDWSAAAMANFVLFSRLGFRVGRDEPRLMYVREWRE